MSRVVVERLGGLDVLSVVPHVERPDVPAGHVLIEVSLAGINPADVAQRETGVNHLGRPADPPFVPGGEVVGTRVDTGERVVAVCGIGGYARWALAPENQVVPVPEGLSDGEALTLIVQGLTAWYLLRTPVGLAAGSSVLVDAAGSAVGTFLVQLARGHGAGTVIATARSADARDQALALGADLALDENDPGLAGAVRDATGGRGVDLALDTVGGGAFEALLGSLALRGHLIVYGAASGDSGTVPARRLIPGSRSLSGFWLLDRLGDAETLRRDFDELAHLALEKELHMPEIHTFPLTAVRDAHHALSARTVRGKLALDPTR